MGVPRSVDAARPPRSPRPKKKERKKKKKKKKKKRRRMASGATIVTRTSSPVRAMATSGTCIEAAPKPSHWAERPPSGAKAKPPTAIRPEPRGPSGTSPSTRARNRRHSAAAAANLRGPSPAISCTHPRAAIDASPADHRKNGSPSCREATATAAGSTSPSSRNVRTVSRSRWRVATTPHRLITCASGSSL